MFCKKVTKIGRTKIYYPISFPYNNILSDKVFLLCMLSVIYVFKENMLSTTILEGNMGSKTHMETIFNTTYFRQENWLSEILSLGNLTKRYSRPYL